MRRLTIDMTDQQHQSLMTMAASRGQTIEEFALERLCPSVDDEERAWDELKALVERRAADGLDGAVSARSVTEILADELRRRRASLEGLRGIANEASALVATDPIPHGDWLHDENGLPR